MTKKVLILGGGLLQMPLIKKAKGHGFEVFLSDYLDNPPGKCYADHSRQISSFSVDENFEYAREEGIDYVLTIGTDQPVYTAASVSARLNLPHPINAEQGRAVTNKFFMKKIMHDHGIPTPRYRVYSNFGEVRFHGLNYPLVMKPVDSQGQRGIFVLQGTEQTGTVNSWFECSKKFSLAGAVIIEEYYPGEEITVNCWVKEGRTHILLVTDRLHFDDTVALGICKQQRYPSRAAEGYVPEISALVQELASAFKIQDGPLYIQMIIGDEGIKIIEFGYRIGGGFEADTIPRISGVDIVDLYFRLVTEGENFFQPEKMEERIRMCSVCFLFACPGKVAKIVWPDEFEHTGKLFIRQNEIIGKVENATSRIGCFTVYADDREDYDMMLKKFDAELAVFSEDHIDLLIHNLWE